MRRVLSLLGVLLGLAVLQGHPLWGAEKPLQGQVSGVLDRWTSFRWGQDNLAWVVHYPEELAEPWVKLEAQRRGFGPEETASYRRSFRQELQFDRSEAFLLTVQSFGGEPLRLSPLSKTVALVDARGRAVAPVRYEKRLDLPLTGLVQGFVFFPKGAAKPPFHLVVKGLLPGEPTVFRFPAFAAAPAPAVVRATPVPTPRRVPSPKPVQGVDLVIPPRKGGAPQPTREPVPRPTRPAAPTRAPVATPVPPAPTAPPPSPPTPEVRVTPRPSVVRLSREETLRRFLGAWEKGDWGTLYAMTGKETQGRYTPKQFEERARNHPFRWALKDGYKLSWTGSTAKVSVAPKFLVMRMLREERFRLEDEGGETRVEW